MKPKNFLKKLQKHNKGQILVFMALVFIGLIAIVGLAIDLGTVFVAYSRLRRAVDSAALASTSQFREGYTQQGLERAANQFLTLNGITDTTDITIEACDFAIIPGDPELCTTPSRKLIRVSVTQDVPLYFLAIVGVRQVPIHVEAISEAASVDLVLLIDNSSSMAQLNTGAEADPHECNPATPGGAGDCHPFEEIKTAAKLLVDRLFLSPDGVAPGYDRVGIVTFDRFPTVRLEMSDNKTTIMNTIDNLTVYEGEYKCPWAYDNGLSYTQWLPLWLAEPATPAHTLAGLEGPCRLYYGGSTNPASGLLNPDGNYITLYTLGMYQTEDLPPSDKDPSNWMVTNSGGGLKVAGRMLGGRYPTGYPRTPVSRESALWVVVWLTDGYTNAGYTLDGETYPQTVANSGVQICPKYTYLPLLGETRWCVDQDARPTVADLQLTPAVSASILGHRHSRLDPLNSNPATAVYDADDYARDMVDFVTNPDTDPLIAGQNALLFTIGLGNLTPQYNYITKRSAYEVANNLPAPGATLLQYGAEKGHGIYYQAPGPAQLNDIFLAIANKIATRLSR